MAPLFVTDLSSLGLYGMLLLAFVALFVAPLAAKMDDDSPVVWLRPATEKDGDG